MKFDPNQPACDMTAAEVMAAHVAVGMLTENGNASGDAIVKKVQSIYKSLEEKMGGE